MQTVPALKQCLCLLRFYISTVILSQVNKDIIIVNLPTYQPSLSSLLLNHAYYFIFILGCSSLISIVIPPSVTAIGFLVFRGDE